MTDKRKYANRAKYLIKAVSKRRREVREMANKYKGGKCAVCGYKKCEKALEFHHKIGQKDFGISKKGYTRSWKKVKKELDKCILLCANCHREVHSKITQLPRETLE
jgi:5-methylcytosine-specific restriction endonuclease McrA